MTDIAEGLDGCIELSVGVKWPHRCLPRLLCITFLFAMIFRICVTCRQQLVRLWTKRWSSMENRQTSASEIHRKVMRMVSSVSELNDRLMLKEMNGSFGEK